MTHPMRVVANKTGLPPETLRAWERRYEGIRPNRDRRDRRVYSDELLEKLIMLSILVDAGYRIGELADRSNVELKRMVSDTHDTTPSDFIPSPSIERAVRSILSLDSTIVWNELEHATTIYGRLDLIDEFVFPLIHRIKQMNRRGGAMPIHLSFAESTLRSFLSTLVVPNTADEGRPVVTFAYPLGQHGDVGAIASAVHAHAAGWRPILLGSQIPAEQIVGAVLQVRAAAAVLVAVSEFYDTSVLNEMIRVRRGLPAEIPVYVGGHLVTPLVQDLKAGGLASLKDMEDLRTTLAAAAKAAVSV